MWGLGKKLHGHQFEARIGKHLFENKDISISVTYTNRDNNLNFFQKKTRFGSSFALL
jgi:hypothetical protein